MERIINTIIIGLLLAATMYLASLVLQKDTEIPPAEDTGMLDAYTQVQQSQIISKQQMVDSLSQRSRQQADRIKRQQEEIEQYVQVEAELDLTRDSLKAERKDIAIGDLMADGDTTRVMRDTTLTYRETFSDSLLSVRADIRFYRDDLSVDLSINQLRPVRLDVTTTLSPDGQRMAYVHSPDFDTVSVRSFREPPEVQRSIWREYWKEMALAGTIVALILK